MMNKFIVLLGSILILAGCSSLPSTITKAPPGDMQLSQVKENIASYQGTLVRWGGSIVSVENDTDKTMIQVVQKELDSSGQPKTTHKSQGRFLMQADQFLDPAIYSEGLDMTVYGPITGEATRMVGNHSLTLPVVKAYQFHLWPEYDRSRYYPYPYYDPYYGPYWPYWRYYPYYPYWW